MWANVYIFTSPKYTHHEPFLFLLFLTMNLHWMHMFISDKANKLALWESWRVVGKNQSSDCDCAIVHRENLFVFTSLNGNIKFYFEHSDVGNSFNQKLWVENFYLFARGDLWIDKKVDQKIKELTMFWFR